MSVPARSIRLLPVLAALTCGAIAGAPASATSTNPVTAWVQEYATTLRTTDPAADLKDLLPLRRSVDHATVVGLGEAVHGAHELGDLKLRVLRLLIEEKGFRSLAWEEDWTTSRKLDHYITSGRGRPRALVRHMTGQWRSKEVLRLLHWLRRYNASAHDPVRFVGLESYYTGRLAYRAVKRYIRRAAPGRLPELHNDLRIVWPRRGDIEAHASWYGALPNKERHLRHARHLYRLVATTPHRPGDRAHALALHHARQIRSFHEYYALSIDAQNRYRDAHAAANLRWWQRRTGDKVAYWAASAHTANAPRLRIAVPGPDFRYPTTGSHLRRTYGKRYLSIGFTFDHGTAGLAPDELYPMPPADPRWFEHPLGRVAAAQFAIDLRHDASPAVRAWLQDRLRTRGLAHAGAASYLAGGTLAQWFDVLVHVQTVEPQHALGERRRR